MKFFKARTGLIVFDMNNFEDQKMSFHKYLPIMMFVEEGINQGFESKCYYQGSSGPDAAEDT